MFVRLCNGAVVKPGGECWDGMRVPGLALGKPLSPEYCCPHPEGAGRASRACGSWLAGLLDYGNVLRNPGDAGGKSAALA